MRPPASPLLWAAPVCLIATLVSADIDLNTNSLSDVWEYQFNVTGLAAAVDTDKDGFTNLQESAAGTNPLDPGSRPELGIGAASSGVNTFWQSVPGKSYLLQTSSTLSVNSWEGVGTLYGTGGLLQMPHATDDPGRFYRMVIKDIDTDTDGLSDWEELFLGYDPKSKHTSRQETEDGPRAKALWAGPSVITVALLDGHMAENWPDRGVIAVRRTGGMKPVTVNLQLGGSALRNLDYTTPVIGNQVNFPLGVREVWVEFTPLADGSIEDKETITLTAQTGTGYSLGSGVAATVELADATAQPPVKAAARFLLQAAFGPDADDADADDIPQNVEDVMALGFEGWIDDQFNETKRPKGLLLPFTEWAVANGNGQQLYGNYKEFAWWARVMADPDPPVYPDTLRQRVAFALSEILVTSDRPEQLAVEQAGMAHYYDLMIKHAFGNYRDLLFDVATHPVMGIYLSHLGNRKADPVNRIYPDENFAREIMQLFSIGLWQLNPDGTRELNGQDQPIPTYNNGDITELARVFTGLSFGNNVNFSLYPRDFRVPMKMWDAEHDCLPKTLLGGLELPNRTPSAGNTGTAGMADVTAAVNNLFNHKNVGPFVCKQLIQRMVTSNPSHEYVGRVAAAFANDGTGVRGNMKAVMKAILLDDEARNPVHLDEPTWGRLREPFLRVVNMARAYNAKSVSGIYALDQFVTDHMQDPMNSPSVFNFFLPNHSPPGPVTQAGLVAPEFQLINASTAISGPNYFWNSINGSLHRWGTSNPNNNVRLQTDAELAMVVSGVELLGPQDSPDLDDELDPDPLLRRLDLALTGGTLSPQQFQIIREAMLKLGGWMWHRERLRMAIYLIVTSPEFNVQR